MKVIFRLLPQKVITSNSTFNFHVSKNARKRYNFDSSLFSLVGDLIIADAHSARELAYKINRKREEDGLPNANVTAGQVNALSLLHELLHLVFRYYEQYDNPGVFERSTAYFQNKLGVKNFNKLLLGFTEEFPPLEVYTGKQTAKEWLAKSTGDKPNKEIIIEELIILHLENLNPLFPSFTEFYDKKIIAERAPFELFVQSGKEFFKQEKPFSALNRPLLDVLEETIVNQSSGIEDQFFGLNKLWALLSRGTGSNPLWSKIMAGTDLLSEDARLFPQGPPAKFTPPVPEYNLDKDYFERLRRLSAEKESERDDVALSYFEEEKFTADLEWMPNVVMMAKNTLVWLDQLSKKYKRDIYRLDQIPDEELDFLARSNFNALWLIGVWERCEASRKIKQFCGNPDAAPSAYSLFDYDIAGRIGGYESFKIFKEKCARRGLRVASDMVPNHTGIFSRWIMDNPDFFIQSDRPPYPNYSFTGPDLSDDHRVEIKIEDRYYDRKDAAVVFRLRENHSGRIRYIYHGNDGTNMPWNDTAQLNLLNPALRESLIQTILKVASDFPIIRFDAAMILAKKHYRRLWFPAPGEGGGVPSRSDYAISSELFNQLMPVEFWREVVDRINSEMPSTLLLAEAFWMLEGYFVRTLGMHRVYNSAFMHMFMKEENGKYRQAIKNTIDFDAQILKRYVNFMSNPDEETAINQFGKGDKYFGVAVMMATLPGLPMFAHGQVEGFTEKYGMEYQRAYYNEVPDEYLVERHKKELFPVLKKRYLFSESQYFELYDYIDVNQNCNENVFAFSNSARNEHALVLYNNSYEATIGKIKYSSGKGSGIDIDDIESGRINVNDEYYKRKRAMAGSKSILEALNMKPNENTFVQFRDTRTGNEFIRPSRDLAENGFELELKGYEYYVFLDFKEVVDTNGNYTKLYSTIGNKGVPSVDTAIKRMLLEPLHKAITDIFKPENIKMFLRYAGLEQIEMNEVAYSGAKIAELTQKGLSDIMREVEDYKGIKLNRNLLVKKLAVDLENLKHLDDILAITGKLRKRNAPFRLIGLPILSAEQNSEAYKSLMIIYMMVRRLLDCVASKNPHTTYSQVYDDLLLDEPLWQSMIRLGYKYELVRDEFEMIKILAISDKTLFDLSDEGFYEPEAMINLPLNKNNREKFNKLFLSLLEKPEVKFFIYYHNAEGVNYFNKERFELLVLFVFTFELIEDYNNFVLRSKGVSFKLGVPNTEHNNDEFIALATEATLFLEEMLLASGTAGYQYDELKRLIGLEVETLEPKKAEPTKKKKEAKIVKEKPTTKVTKEKEDKKEKKKVKSEKKEKPKKEKEKSKGKKK